jgi:hypothetical protein
MMKNMIRSITVVIMLLTIGLLTDGVFNGGIFTKEALAIIGRPLTPGSVAGVARRTTRRTIRRTSVYIATLPRGCTTVVMEGMTLHQCGGTYYQPYNNQYVVVEVN